MKRNKLLTALAAICFMLILVALPCMTACGEPTPTTPAPTTPAPTTPAPTTPAPTAPAPTTPAPTAPAPTTPEETWNLTAYSGNSETYWQETEVFTPYYKSIEERTGGRVKTTVHYDASLCPPPDMLPNLKSGLIDQGMFNAVWYAGEFPVCDILQLPFLIDSPKAAGAVMNELYSQGLAPEFDGMKVASFNPTDMQRIMFREKKVTTLEELKGMKMRAPGGLFVDILSALGATPVSIVTTEVYMALERGVVDGVMSSPGFMMPAKFYEVADYLVADPVCIGTSVSVYNLDTWNSFPDDIKAIIDECNQEMYLKWLEVNAEQEQASIDGLAANGVEVYSLDPGELARWEEATLPVIDGWIEKMDGLGYSGQQLVDAAKAANTAAK